jgi:hypothetical protein
MIELRKMPVTMSPAPATPRVINDKPSESERPKTTIAAPTRNVEHRIGRPWYRISLARPENTVARNAPQRRGGVEESQDERSMGIGRR